MPLRSAGEWFSVFCLCPPRITEVDNLILCTRHIPAVATDTKHLLKGQKVRLFKVPTGPWTLGLGSNRISILIRTCLQFGKAPNVRAAQCINLHYA